MCLYHAQLSGSFFTLAISAGVADLFFLIGKLVIVTLAQRFYPQFAFAHEALWALCGQFITWTIYWVVVLNIAAITINRFMALVWPIRL